MATEQRDPVTGRMTTGHEWNGIEELDTPVPRVVLFFLALGTLFAVAYWVLMPAWPLVETYTKGTRGFDQRATVIHEVEQAAAARAAAWTERLAAVSYAEALADPALMGHVQATGQRLFIDNCAACHGVQATGGPGFPDLTAKSWLWGGEPEALEATIRLGINSLHPDSRVSQMLGFGREGLLSRAEVHAVVAHVRSLSGAAPREADADKLEAGKALFAANCASCHGETGTGSHAVGAPDLTDSHWIYGGDSNTLFATVFAGRQGVMPTWGQRLAPIDIRILALYVHRLGTVAP